MSEIKFKEGDRVRCIDNNEDGYALTLGGDYRVIKAYGEGHYNYVIVLNDNGREDEFYEGRFIKVSEVRNDIISEILS